MNCVRCRVEKHPKLIMMTVPKHKRLTVLCLRINYEVLMNSDIYFKANLNWMCDAHDSCLWNRSGFDPLWTDVALTLRVFRVCSHYLTLITSLLFENLFKRNSENTRKRCDTHFPSILHIHLPRNVCVCVFCLQWNARYRLSVRLLILHRMNFQSAPFQYKWV